MLEPRQDGCRVWRGHRSFGQTLGHGSGTAAGRGRVWHPPARGTGSLRPICTATSVGWMGLLLVSVLKVSSSRSQAPGPVK